MGIHIRISIWHFKFKAVESHQVKQANCRKITLPSYIKVSFSRACNYIVILSRCSNSKISTLFYAVMWGLKKTDTNAEKLKNKM